MKRDMIWEKGGENLYNMCGNNSVDRWDFRGYIWPFDKGDLLGRRGLVDNTLTAITRADRVADGVRNVLAESDPTITPAPPDTDGSRYADLFDAIFADNFHATNEESKAAFNTLINSYSGISSVSWGIGVIFGKSTVTCCDENKCKWKAVYTKICIGPMAILSFSGGAIVGLEGENCPSGYRGDFLEIAASYSILGGSFGTKFDGVNTTEAGVGPGGKIGAAYCFYYYEPSESSKIGFCCD